MSFNEELLDGARAAYLAARGESDLITIKEAATLVDRTVPTLKKWIKKGELKGTYTEEGITNLCEGLKGSSVTSLRCAATLSACFCVNAR